MCGIAGIFKGTALVTPEDTAAVERMTQLLLHRGPDAGGTYIGCNAVLGSRRLSIIDLSEAGAMPMTNEDRQIWVTYNGEIYNCADLRKTLIGKGHVFRSHADTEILVHGYEEWGAAGLLERLRGMFAFAIYDLRLGLIMLARDRFGIKPLYYSVQNNQIVFASEVQAIRQSGLVPTDDDPEGILLFLLFGSIPTPKTVFRSIQSLPAGHYMVANQAGIRVEKYYDIDPLFQDPPSDRVNECAADVELGIRQSLEQVVDSHLISDAPIGVFLSGGLDSTALVALATRSHPKVETLGVVFGEEGYSEEPYQTLVAERFGTTHHRVNISLTDFHHELESFVSRMDVPTVDGLNTYFVARAAKEVGLKAVLSGLGADEIFAGYKTLQRAATLSSLHSMPKSLRSPLVGLTQTMPQYRKLAFLERDGAIPLYLVQRGLFTPRQAAKLLDGNESDAWNIMSSLEPKRPPADPQLQQQFMEVRHYLADQLLRDSDVFGMAHSLEIRVPFLDHELVEKVCRTPLKSRLPNGTAKPLLTHALQDMLPKEIVARRKQGFTLPMDPWLRLSRSFFHDAGQRFSQKEYDLVWEDFLVGRSHWSRPWALAVLARSS